MTRIAVGQQAPPFALKTMSGKPISLASVFKQSPTILVFFKITCPVCQFVFPFLERIHDAFRGEASVLAVSQDDERDTTDFLGEYRVSFPVVLDEPGYPVSNAYGLTNVPTLFLIDASGETLVTSVGFVRADLEEIWRSLTERLSRTPAALFHPDEDIPSFKPG